MVWDAGSIRGSMVLDTAKYDAALNRSVEETQKSANALRQTAEKAGHDVAEGLFHQIKQSVGRRSILGESAELLAGGGVMAGLSIAGEQINKLAESVIELREMSSQGGHSWDEYAEKVGSSVPVVGEFFKVGLSVNEMLTGQKSALKEAREEEERWNAVRENFHELRGFGHHDELRHRDVMNDMAWGPLLDNSTGLMHTLYGITKETEGTLQHLRDKIGEAHDGMIAGVDLLPEKNQKTYAAALAALRTSPESANSANVEEYAATHSVWGKVPGTTWEDAMNADKDYQSQLDRHRQVLNATVADSENAIRQAKARVDSEIAGFTWEGLRKGVAAALSSVGDVVGDRMEWFHGLYEKHAELIRGQTEQLDQMVKVRWKNQYETMEVLFQSLLPDNRETARFENALKDLVGADKWNIGKDLARQADQAGLSQWPLKLDEIRRMTGPHGLPLFDVEEMGTVAGLLNEIALKVGVFTKLKDIDKDLGQAWMTPIDRQLDNMRRELGPKGKPLWDEDNFEKASKSLHALDRAQKDASIFDRLKDEIRTPEDRLNEELMSIRAGIKAHPELEPFRRRMEAQSRQDIFGQDTLPPAIQSGSAEAVAIHQLELNALHGRRETAVATTQLSAMQSMVDEQRETNKILRNSKVLDVADGIN